MVTPATPSLSSTTRPTCSGTIFTIVLSRGYGMALRRLLFPLFRCFATRKSVQSAMSTPKRLEFTYRWRVPQSNPPLHKVREQRTQLVEPCPTGRHRHPHGSRPARTPIYRRRRPSGGGLGVAGGLAVQSGTGSGRSQNVDRRSGDVVDDHPTPISYFLQIRCGQVAAVQNLRLSFEELNHEFVGREVVQAGRHRRPHIF
jgi:hypothetical protein